MKEKLYELTAQYRDVLDGIYVDTETGEIVGGTELDKLEGAINDKAEAIAVVIKEKTAFADACKAEIDQLNKRQKSALREADFLKEYLKTNLDALSIPKLKTPRCSISFRTSYSVDITDKEKIPTAFMVSKTTVEPDKVAIKEAINNGELVDGAVLVTKRNIQVK